jgi:MoxR-like ATPase
MGSIPKWASTVTAAVEQVFYGKRAVIEHLLVALLSGGHVLLEDVPGVGKTILARALAACMGGSFARIQCTPDLLPTDVLGVSVFDPKEQTFRFREGPILSNVVLVDEINRATPRTQAALLEAMAEHQVTIEGRRIALPRPFFLIATENPVEFEGTFPLPEAQRDRFLMSVRIGYPERAVEEHLLDAHRRTTHPVEEVAPGSSASEIEELREQVVQIHVEDSVRSYILDLVEASRRHGAVRLGVSPRGSLALYRCVQARAAVRGRSYALPDDVKELAPSVFAERIVVSPEAGVKGTGARQVIEELLDRVTAPYHSEGE